MGYRTRVNFTAEQKVDIWGYMQRGESINAFERAFDCPFSSIFVW